MQQRTFAALAFGAALALGACIAVVEDDADVDEHKEHAEHMHMAEHTGAAPRSATARLEARSGSNLSGFATFVEKEGGVLVTLTVEGVTPGLHAVHIHEVGDCSAPDGASAGGHFNPAGHNHGAPHAAERHAGDLGNLWIEDDGTGYHAVFMHDLTVDEGPFGVVGRSIIVHEKADDLVSQPTGAAGGRIGCGEIR